MANFSVCIILNLQALKAQLIFEWVNECKRSCTTRRLEKFFGKYYRKYMRCYKSELLSNIKTCQNWLCNISRVNYSTSANFLDGEIILAKDRIIATCNLEAPMLPSRLEYTIELFVCLYAIFISFVCYKIQKLSIFYIWFPNALHAAIFSPGMNTMFFSKWNLTTRETNDLNRNFKFSFLSGFQPIQQHNNGPRHRFTAHNRFCKHACHYIHTVHLKILLGCP